MFSPSRAFFPGTMASADFLRFVVAMLRFEFVYSLAPARPPRVSVITFTSYICCIYALNFGQYRTLFCLASSSISKRLFLCSFCSVRSIASNARFCLRLLSDSASRRTPLSLLQRRDFIFRYIFVYYNRNRISSVNPGGLSPAAYREWVRANAPTVA